MAKKISNKIDGKQGAHLASIKDKEKLDYEREVARTTREMELLREHLSECICLLAYDEEKRTFPLKNPCKIAAFGNGVRRSVKGGTGSGEVNSIRFITVEQGLLDAGFTVTSTKWLDAYDEIAKEAHTAFIKKIKKEAREAHEFAVNYGMGKIMPEPEYSLELLEGCRDAEVAIYVLARICGEGSDREPVKGDVLLTDTEVRDILYLNEHFEHFMLVLNVGGPVDLTPVLAVKNILLLSQLGSDTGLAFTDVLLGKTTPSGHLSATWSGWQDYCPLDFGDRDDTYYYEGIYVGYRYFDQIGRKAQFPFGFGLSYTTFELKQPDVRLDSGRFGVVHLRMEVENTGDHNGRESIQVYVTVPAGRQNHPVQELAGFAKTPLLAKGEHCTIELEIDLKDLAAFDEPRSQYGLEAGDYVIRIGNNSRNTKIAAYVNINEYIVTKKVRDVLVEHDFEEMSFADSPLLSEDEAFSGSFIANPPHLYLKASEIMNGEEQALFTVDYESKRSFDEILPEVEKLTDAELTYLLVGAFDPKMSLNSMIGNSGHLVAGTAGETTSMLREYGIMPISMADGPAGVRLSRKFYVDRGGVAHSIGEGGLPQSVLEYMPGILRWGARTLGGGKSNAPSEYPEQHHFATAIPIGTAIAQTWNPNLAQTFGNLVGREMKHFGVHLWLAPALNVQRSILCGRNFEYYSEDPLLSGKIAAAITRGVQSVPGCGVTIKHFVANNQEYNRTGNSSHMSERALREIYMRGFELCVREASPKAIMSSYNLINQTHVSETRSLIYDYLRRENGFDGIVMTDWIVNAPGAGRKNRYRNSLALHVAAAGGDLFMPGGKGDYKSILEGIRDGRVDLELVKISASRVLKLIKELTGFETVF